MAELVQKNLEEMLPELEHIKRLKLFTEEEIRRVLKIRKGHEYKIRRRTKCKADFLAYIQYESNLLTLVRERQRKLGYTSKKTEIDYSIINRIIKLFKMAEYRFQADVKLWLSHIQFCRKIKDLSGCSALFGRMLQVHSNKPELWIMYAKFEFEEANSTDSSRSLMQRALRYNVNSTVLWVEYFRLELLFAEKMRKRRDILTGPGQKPLDDKVLDGVVAGIVFKQAMQQIPGDVNFALSFLEVCTLFKFASTLRQAILAHIMDEFSNEPEVWMYEAKAAVCYGQATGKAPSEASQDGYEVMEAHLETHGHKVWHHYLTFCQEMSETDERQDRRSVTHFLSVLERAQEAAVGLDKPFLSPLWYLTWIAVLKKVGEVERMSVVCQQAVKDWPANVPLWKALLKFMAIPDRSCEALQSAFSSALKSVKSEDALPLWKLMIDLAIASGDEQRTEDLLKSACGQCKEVSDVMKESYISWAALCGGIKKCRKVYKRICKFLPVPLKAIEAYVSAERLQVDVDADRISRAFETAAREYGASNVDVWLNYIHWESEGGDLARVASLEWRARKALDGPLVKEFLYRSVLAKSGADSHSKVSAGL